MLAGGLIIDSGFLGGWPGVFYTFGALALVWLCFWTYIVYDSPAEHPRIGQEELIYIEGSMCGQTTLKKLPTPWKQILRSKTVWAITAAQFADSWGLYTLLSYMPIYMSSVLHFNINDNSLLSALPYFCMMVVALVSSWIADQLRTKRVLSTRNTRRLMNVIGEWGPTLGLIAVSYAGCNKVLTVALLTFTVAFGGAVSAGYLVSHIDIAPNHAGSLMSFCNCIANLAGIIAPYVAGSITTDESNLASWRIVFFLAAAVYFVLNLIYLIFASGTEQTWNRQEENDK
jgi:sugar phosphate permease